MDINRRGVIGLGAVLLAVGGGVWWLWPNKPKGRFLDLEGAWVCGFFSAPRFSRTVRVWEPDKAAMTGVRLITNAVGLVQNFEVLAGDFKRDVTAFAIVKDHRRYVVYDHEKFRWKDGRPDWKAVAVLGHEIGHHLNGHTVDGEGSRHETELEADRFSGFAVSRLHGTLDNAMVWHKRLSEKGSDTHPPRAQRMQAVEAGWRHSESLKKREPVTCATEWLGKPFDIKGETCRVGKVCGTGKTQYKVACEGQKGVWYWQK